VIIENGKTIEGRDAPVGICYRRQITHRLQYDIRMGRGFRYFLPEEEGKLPPKEGPNTVSQLGGPDGNQ